MQLMVIQSDRKKKNSSSKCQNSTDKLQYVLDYNISLAMAKTKQHLSMLIFMANFTLPRRDSFLDHPRSGIKPDTLNALRTAPLNMTTLFRDYVLKKTEEDIAEFENKGYSGSSCHKKRRYHPYERHSKSSKEGSQPVQPVWQSISHGHSKKGLDKCSNYTS